MRLFLENHPHTFDPDTIELLSTALDDAWQHVQCSGLAFKDIEAGHEVLAKCIVDAAREGITGPKSLVEKALLRFQPLGVP